MDIRKLIDIKFRQKQKANYNIHLFHPLNLNENIIGSPNITKHLKRFAPMREVSTANLATIGRTIPKASGRKKPTEIEIIGSTKAQASDLFTNRWEQTICQLSNNALKLFSLEPTLKMFSNCVWEKNNWKPISDQCMDLEIIEHFDEENGEFYTVKDIINGYADTPLQKRILSFSNIHLAHKFNENSEQTPSIIHQKISDKSKKPYFSTFINTNTINMALFKDLNRLQDTYTRQLRYQKRSGIKFPLNLPSVYLFKVIVPGHFTLALYYPLEKRVEFFDSGGSFGKIKYRDASGNVPFSTTLEKTKTLRRPISKKKNIKGSGARVRLEDIRCLGDVTSQTDEIDDLVSIAFKILFPESELVAINTKNIQISDEDAHCQTWIYLYVYIKFILGISTQNTLKYLESLSKKELLILIREWRKYLLYFDF